MRWLLLLTLATLALGGCSSQVSQATNNATKFVKDKYGVIVRSAHCMTGGEVNGAQTYRCTVFTESSHEVLLRCSTAGCEELNGPTPIQGIDWPHNVAEVETP